MFNYPPFHRLIRLQLRHHNAAHVEAAAIQLQAHLFRIFGMRVSTVIVPPVERLQAYHMRELTLRIEQSANIAEAKRRLKEALEYIQSIPTCKGIKIITDVDS